MWFKASAPGSLMLLGEYAVLQGGLALACAIDKRITVYLSPRTDTEISISSRLGKYACDINNIVVHSPFEFVLTAIKRFQSQLTVGCDLTIESEFSNRVGFSSSAAVTVAVIVAFSHWVNQVLDPMQVIALGRSVVQEVQGKGSGADIAAATLGGVVAYQMEPLRAQRLSYTFPITVVYSGSKTTTGDALRKVDAAFAGKEASYQALCQEIHACAELGMKAINEQQWVLLGQAMNAQQKLMEKLGVNTPALDEIITKLNQAPGILGAKISGSGLGDCAVGLGSLSDVITFEQPTIQLLATLISAQGVECEKG